MEKKQFYKILLILFFVFLNYTPTDFSFDNILSNNQKVNLPLKSSFEIDTQYKKDYEQDTNEIEEAIKNKIKAEIINELKEQLKKEITAEIMAEIKKGDIIIEKDSIEGKDIIAEFKKFIESIALKDINKTSFYFYDPVFNFNSGTDITKEEMKSIFLDYFTEHTFEIETYKDSFEINNVYFFKSGFRPPITERIGEDDKLIVLSIIIEPELNFPFPSDDSGNITIYWIKKPSSEKHIIAIGVLSDIL